MSSETYSVLVWYWHDMQTDATQLRVMRVDTGEEVHLSDGSLLLRIFSTPDSSVVRCQIRHIGSGREAYLQSGQGIRNFISAYLLDDDNLPRSPDSS